MSPFLPPSPFLFFRWQRTKRTCDADAVCDIGCAVLEAPLGAPLNEAGYWSLCAGGKMSDDMVVSAEVWLDPSKQYLFVPCCYGNRRGSSAGYEKPLTMSVCSAMPVELRAEEVGADICGHALRGLFCRQGDFSTNELFEFNSYRMGGSLYIENTHASQALEYTLTMTNLEGYTSTRHFHDPEQGTIEAAQSRDVIPAGQGQIVALFSEIGNSRTSWASSGSVSERIWCEGEGGDGSEAEDMFCTQYAREAPKTNGPWLCRSICKTSTAH